MDDFSVSVIETLGYSIFYCKFAIAVIFRKLLRVLSQNLFSMWVTLLVQCVQ